MTRTTVLDIETTVTRNAYLLTVLMASQEAWSVKGPGGETPNPALLGESRSMQQLELSDYLSVGYRCGVCDKELDTERGRDSHELQVHDASRPWHDEEGLHRLFVEEGLSAHQIAEKWDCSHQVVSDWINRFEITRPSVPWQDKEVLERLYVEQERSKREVGKIVGCSGRTVGKWLHEHGIETRGRGGRHTPDALADEDKLYDLYIGQELSVWEIGDRIGESGELVWWWLHNHDIETRGPGGVDAIEDFRDEGLVRELYVEQELTTNQIARQYGCSPSAVWIWVCRHGIETRRRGGRVGELNAAWKGGHVKHRRGAWQRQREAAKTRDGYACRWCGMDEEKHKKSEGMGLDVHHIVQYHTFEDPFEANKLDNLMTLCRRCHKAIEGRSGVEE